MGTAERCLLREGTGDEAMEAKKKVLFGGGLLACFALFLAFQFLSPRRSAPLPPESGPQGAAGTGSA